MRNTPRRRSLLFLLFALPFLGLGCRTAEPIPDSEPPGTVGRISPIGRMGRPRAAHTATLLPNGKVLLAGGFAGDESGMASVELYDPTTNTFTRSSNMAMARQSHTATLLPSGKVLLAGGFNGRYLASAELYDPLTERFTPTGSMVVGRSGHVATLLPNGQVLLVGGTGAGWTFLASAELYDPVTQTFSATGDMAAARESHTATLLLNGKVLVTGGHRGRHAAIVLYAAAELYDPATGAFAPTGKMTRSRHKHDATLLADGHVLIVGGADERDGAGAYTSVELYQPAKGIFTTTGDMKAARYKLQGTTVLLANGRILIAGGASRAEIFDPTTNRFAYAAGEMGTKRLFATATRLSNGQVLIAGGYAAASAASSQAWIYRT